VIDRISEEDLIIFELLRNPIASTEILFSNLGSLSEFEEDKFSKVRKYQYNYLSYDQLLFDNKELTEKEFFNLKKGMSETYILGGRLTGKSLIGLIVDVVLALFHNTFHKGSVSSADAEKIKKVCEQIFVPLEFHPILKLLNIRVIRNPYQAKTPSGTILESVNENVAGKNPGGNYHGRHDEKSWIEEASYQTNSIAHERLMAQSEMGIINHYTGMTTFAKESPMGKIFYNLKNENKLINFPSYVNHTWDDDKEEAAIREFGGKSSSGYQVQIDGKVIENGESVFIIEKIRDTYIRDAQGIPLPIKSFEINTNNFFRFKDIVIIDRPNNAESIHIHADIGEGSAPTEIIVLSKIKDVYKYIYNITTFKIAPDENEIIFRYLIETLKANVVGLDITSGGGKALFCSLAKDYNQTEEHIFGVAFNEKVTIGYKLDEKGNATSEHVEEFVTDWSIQRLKHIFYNEKIKCYWDLKLDSQLDGVIVMKSGQRTVYGNKTQNHLFQAFQVFSVCDWNTEFLSINPIQQRKLGGGSFGSKRE